MTKETIYTEAMTRVYRDTDALNALQRKNPLPLLWMARGCEVLTEAGYEPVPQAGSVFWHVRLGSNGGRYAPTLTYSEVFDSLREQFHEPIRKSLGVAFREHLPPMHCWIFERSTNSIVDFAVELLKTKADRAFGPGLQHPFPGDFLWQPVSSITGIGYQPSELAASIAARVWAKLVTGPLRLQLQCDCGRVQRIGCWSNGLPSPNAKPWVGKRAYAVCPSCRTRGVKAQ